MTLRETHVEVDFIADADPLKQINQEINKTLHHTRLMGKAYDGLTDTSRAMLDEMKDGWNQQRTSLLKYRNDMVEVEYGYYKLARDAQFFKDNTTGYLKEVEKLGKTHKKITDQMMANNWMAKQSILQQVGAMANMSTQASKNIAAYKQMKNPLYLVNNAGLTLVDTMGKFANRSTAAAIALQRLGPTANMKELNDEIKRLNQGLGALPIVAIGAGLGAFFLYGALHKAAMGNKEYEKSFKTMVATLREAVQPMVDAFIAVMVPIYNFITAIARMVVEFNKAHPLLSKMLQGVVMLIPALTLLLLPLGLGIGLIKGYALAFSFLFRMIAPVITFIGTMSATVWIVAAALVALAVGLNYAWNHFAGFRNAVINTWNAIVAFLMPGIQAIKNFFLQIGMEIKTWWDQNSAVIIAGVMVVVNLIKGWIQQLAPIFAVAFGAIVVVVQTAWEFIKMAVKMAVDLILAVIKALAQFLTGDFAGAWQTLKDMSKQHLEAMKTAVVNIFNNIKSFLQGIDLVQIGKDIIQGLVDGMTAMLDKVLDIAAKIGNAVKGAVSKVLGVASPAKEMIKIGIFTGQGMQLGLQQSFPLVQQAAYEMGSIPMDYTPENSVSTTNNRSNRSVVYSPTIHVDGNSTNATNVRQQVKEVIEEQFNYLLALYNVEVDY